MRIGHASGSEHGTKYGSKGDQTGKEVCIKSAYIATGGWTCVLRPINNAIAEESATACETLANNPNVGYCQNTRNSLHTELKLLKYNYSKLAKKCNTDCSAFMTACAIIAGVIELEYTGNAPTTSTMENAFVKTKKYISLRDAKYTKSLDYLQRGDILVKAGKHTVMVLDNGPKVAVVDDIINPYNNFIIDCKKILGGATPAEVLANTVTVSRYYNNCHAIVSVIQRYLNAIGYDCGTVDGCAGPTFDAAVKKYQKANGCTVDGEITAKCKTWKKLLDI